MTALFGEAGEVMGSTFESMGEKSLQNIITACSRFDFYPYPKDVQQRMYFEFGSKEIDARQAKTILRRYPFIHSVGNTFRIEGVLLLLLAVVSAVGYNLMLSAC